VDSDAAQREIAAILDFWFGALDARGLSAPRQHRLWFAGGTEADAACGRFAGALARARRGALDHWADGDRGLVALIVLLDQFSRNLHRGTPLAFAADARSRDLTRTALAGGRHLRLPAIHRAFVYMPLEHSESPADQSASVRLFEGLARALPDPMLESFARYARAHSEVIARFGRFPHRNAILGRESTAAERKHLATRGGF